jgi:hypothetical protein
MILPSHLGIMNLLGIVKSGIGHWCRRLALVSLATADSGCPMPDFEIPNRRLMGSPLFLSDLLMGHEPHFEFLLVINGLRTRFMESAVLKQLLRSMDD